MPIVIGSHLDPPLRHQNGLAIRNHPKYECNKHMRTYQNTEFSTKVAVAELVID